MDLTLTRNDNNSTGIYGCMSSIDGSFACVTLEHAYLQDDNTWAAKTLPGAYTCVLGTHQLDHGGPQELYEITNDGSHVGILIHCGNADSDSDGCLLVGETRVANMITNSRITLEKLMTLQNGNNFILTVI